MTGARYEVQIVHPVTGKPKVWATYANRELAEVEAAKLRVHKMFAQVRRVENESDPFTSRRRFLIAALMAGWTSPQVVVDRIVAEIESEAAS